MPENKYAESIRINRVLLAVAFTALVLLGPSFMLGYMSGYRSARGNGQPAAAEASGPTQTVAKQSTRTNPRKPAARVKTRKSVLQSDPVEQ